VAGQSVAQADDANLPATNTTVDQLFSDADLDWRDAERIRFVRDVVMEGLSPSNNLVRHPLGSKALIDTGGFSACRRGERIGCCRPTPTRSGVRQPPPWCNSSTTAVTEW
jgi:hypothetical protein